MSAKRALVLGAAGQLGRACMDCAPKAVATHGFSRASCDVTDDLALRRVMDEVDPHIVINAAAYTAVDAAEDNGHMANAVNAEAPAKLSAICAQRGARLVHLSTDFVFDGRSLRPYMPHSDPAPLGVYGASKWRGEQAVLAGDSRHVVVRTSWVYGPGGRNFVLTMLRLMRERGTVRVVNDQIGSPTSTQGLAKICWMLADREDAGGVYHWSDEGAISWYDFASGIHQEALALGLLSAPASVEPMPTKAFPTKARRPAYSVLDCSETCSALGVAQRPWHDALCDMLRSQQQLEGTA